MHADPGVAVVMVVGVHERVEELPGVGEGDEPVWEGGQVLHRLEQRLRVGGCRCSRAVGPGSDHAQIGQQSLHGLGRHRRATVGVHDLGGVPCRPSASRIISLASRPSSQECTMAPTM